MQLRAAWSEHGAKMLRQRAEVSTLDQLSRRTRSCQVVVGNMRYATQQIPRQIIRRRSQLVCEKPTRRGSREPRGRRRARPRTAQTGTRQPAASRRQIKVGLGRLCERDSGNKVRSLSVAAPFFLVERASIVFTFGARRAFSRLTNTAARHRELKPLRQKYNESRKCARRRAAAGRLF